MVSSASTEAAITRGKVDCVLLHSSLYLLDLRHRRPKLSLRGVLIILMHHREVLCYNSLYGKTRIQSYSLINYDILIINRLTQPRFTVVFSVVILFLKPIGSLLGELCHFGIPLLRRRSGNPKGHNSPKRLPIGWLLLGVEDTVHLQQ